MSNSDSLYEKLTNDEDARSCADIAEDACQVVPRSFALILASSVLTKLGDALASPKTTLAWATSIVGAPAFVLGLLVPLRESGSLIPQLFIGGIVRQLALRKWVWVTGSIVQCLSIVGVGLIVITLQGVLAGWFILCLVTIFSLARGFCSIASKDVLGKTVPKARRGQLTGWAASGAGLIALTTGIVVIWAGRSDSALLIGAGIAGAGTLWLAAAAVYARVPEQPGETGGGASAMRSLQRLHLLMTDGPFRRFVIARALLMCSALSAPFYVALAQDRLDSPGWLLGLFIASAGLADLVSAPVWGRFADRSSKSVMVAAGCVTAGAGLTVWLSDLIWPQSGGFAWLLPAAYFVLSVAHSGVRVGRKTYVVDLAGGNKRTDYVAISNTIIGVLLLLVGSIGLMTPLLGVSGIIGVLALMGLAGAAMSATLRRV